MRKKRNPKHFAERVPQPNRQAKREVPLSVESRCFGFDHWMTEFGRKLALRDRPTKGLNDAKRMSRVVQESIASNALGGDGDADHCCGSLVCSLLGLRAMARAKHFNLVRQQFQQSVAVGLILGHGCWRGHEIAAHARGHVSRVAAKLPLGLREVVSSRRSDSDKRCEHSGKRVHGADEIMAIAAKAACRAVAGRLVEHL
jgi:hypothetical protein